MFLLPDELKFDVVMFLLAFDSDQDWLSSLSDFTSVIPQEILFVLGHPPANQNVVGVLDTVSLSTNFYFASLSLPRQIRSQSYKHSASQSIDVFETFS